MNLGQRLKKLRKSLNLTQREFALRLPGKTGNTYIGMIERGKQHPSLKLLERIGKAYSVPVSYFFEDSKERSKGAVNYLEILDWLTEWEEEAETLARSYKGEYIMYGYWKAVAAHIVNMKEDFQKFIKGEKG